MKHRPGSEGNVATFGGTRCAMVPHSTISPKVVFDASKKVSHILLYTRGYYVTLRSHSLLVLVWAVRGFKYAESMALFRCNHCPRFRGHDGAQFCFKNEEKKRNEKKTLNDSHCHFSLSRHTVYALLSTDIKKERTHIYFISKERTVLQAMFSRWWTFSCK